MTDIALKDSDETPFCHKWHKNYGFVKAMIVSNLNVEAKKVGARVAAKRAKDEEDIDVKVIGVKKAVIINSSSDCDDILTYNN